MGQIGIMALSEPSSAVPVIAINGATEAWRGGHLQNESQGEERLALGSDLLQLIQIYWELASDRPPELSVSPYEIG